MIQLLEVAFGNHAIRSIRYGASGQQDISRIRSKSVRMLHSKSTVSFDFAINTQVTEYKIFIFSNLFLKTQFSMA